MKTLGFILIIVLVTNAAVGEDPLRYCRPDNPVSTLSYIAEQQGFFRSEGLEIEFIRTSNAKPCQDALISGRADIMQGAEAAFVYLGASNPPIRILASLGSNGEQSIIGRKDRGIFKVGDLKGKKIGYLPGSTSFFYLFRNLEKNNLKLSDVSLVPLQPPSMPPALSGGAVDATVMWEPWSSLAEQSVKSGTSRLMDPDAYRYEPLFLATTEVLKQQPKKIEAVLRALLRAEEYIKTNKANSIEFLSKAFRMDHDLLTRIWAGYEHHISLKRELVEKLTNDFRLLQTEDKNFTRATLPDFMTYVDKKPLSEIASDRVMLEKIE